MTAGGEANRKEPLGRQWREMKDKGWGWHGFTGRTSEQRTEIGGDFQESLCVLLHIED